MPGWIFRPQAPGKRRTTLVMNLGSDEASPVCGTKSSKVAWSAAYTVVVFEGPGQQSMLFERDIPFRPDWENVLTPVVDYLSPPRRRRRRPALPLRRQPGRLLGARAPSRSNTASLPRSPTAASSTSAVLATEISAPAPQSLRQW